MHSRDKHAAATCLILSAEPLLKVHPLVYTWSPQARGMSIMLRVWDEPAQQDLHDSRNGMICEMRMTTGGNQVCMGRQRVRASASLSIEDLHINDINDCLSSQKLRT